MLPDLIDQCDYLIPLALGHKQVTRTGSFSSLLGGQNKRQDGSSPRRQLRRHRLHQPPTHQHRSLRTSTGAMRVLPGMMSQGDHAVPARAQAASRVSGQGLTLTLPHQTSLNQPVCPRSLHRSPFLSYIRPPLPNRREQGAHPAQLQREHGGQGEHP